ncbi:MAG: septum formation protein Maf [SAR116 cluster bacterium]|nr:MAG: septum formation protein Maf [SAR116 cluster bacterium]|tara:strand:- start:312 stop:890 length:579 start_codon:yes stop_codon:yes gene_type:complete
MTIPPIILASASPRRRDLLCQIGIEPMAIIPTDINETPNQRELPPRYALRMADEKARAIVLPDGIDDGAVVLAGDTVVAVGRRILPKAETEDQARSCLALLSGRRHRVYGGIALRLTDGTLRSRLVTSSVIFKRLHRDEIDAYIATGDWQGKAGGYAIQGPAAAHIRHIEGSYSNIVGFSLYDVSALLAASE